MVLRTGDEQKKAVAKILMVISEKITPIVSEMEPEELLVAFNLIEESEKRGLSLKEEASLDPDGLRRAVRLIGTLKHHLENSALTKNEVVLAKKMAQGLLSENQIIDALDSKNETAILNCAEKIKKTIGCDFDIDGLFSHNQLPTAEAFEITSKNFKSYMNMESFIAFQNMKESREAGQATFLWKSDPDSDTELVLDSMKLSSNADSRKRSELVSSEWTRLLESYEKEVLFLLYETDTELKYKKEQNDDDFVL